MAVDAFLERGNLEDFVHGEFAGLADFAFDGDDPRRGVEVFRVFRGIAFVGAEFVEIVVVGDVFVSVLLFGGAEGALGEARELCCRKGGSRWESKVEQAFACRGSSARNSHGLQEFAPIQIGGLGCDVGVSQIWDFADQHLVPRDLLGRFWLTIILRAFLSIGCWNLTYRLYVQFLGGRTSFRL